ncbi:MAG TPA: rod shape-determining protein MreD [Virgibacillus sp.]|nr:rod shape-determining protein MreD [Virgibacillus sp.]
MKHLYLPLILFLMLNLEGVAIELLPNFLVNTSSLIVPHWVFVFLLFIAIFFDDEDTYYSILYAAIFGLLIDVVYTNVLGVYMFSYAIIVYIIHELKRLFHANLLVTIMLGFIGVALADLSIYMIYSVIGLTDMLWGDYLVYRLLPTALANIIFLIIFYPISRKKLLYWQEETLADGKFL